MRKVLGPDFFDRSTLLVAKELLGKYLVRRVGGKEVALMITETEAYWGFKDQASKARRGKTPGNAPMYAGPGTMYVYFTYGMHWMLNIVTEREEYPAAVLIRGVVPVQKGPFKKVLGSPVSRAARSRARLFSQGLFATAPLLDGPAKLTKHLQIDKSLNGLVLGKKAGLWVEDRGAVVRPRDIQKTPRIGIAYAGEYVSKPWRFVLASSSRGGR